MAYPNGRIPTNTLTRIRPGNFFLLDAAAQSFFRMNAAFKAHFGHDIGVTDAYRDLATQQELRDRKGTWAAWPGTSNHGWGIALDLGTRINLHTSAEHKWMDRWASQFGWVNPVWASNSDPRDGQFEPWHWEYVAHLDQHEGGQYAAREYLAKGDRGEDVKELQRLLGIPGVNGEYDDETTKWVKAFQVNQGLDPDGKVGPKTWAALRKPKPKPPTVPVTPPVLPPEVQEMDMPFVLIQPDTTQWLVTPQPGLPRATKIYKGETAGLKDLPQVKIGAKTWPRLKNAFQWVEA